MTTIAIVAHYLRLVCHSQAKAMLYEYREYNLCSPSGHKAAKSMYDGHRDMCGVACVVVFTV